MVCGFIGKFPKKSVVFVRKFPKKSVVLVRKFPKKSVVNAKIYTKKRLLETFRFQQPLLLFYSFTFKTYCTTYFFPFTM